MGVESNFNLNNILNKNELGLKNQIFALSFEVELPSVQIYFFMSSSRFSYYCHRHLMVYPFHINRIQNLLSR